jgi:hypothetical protein
MSSSHSSQFPPKSIVKNKSYEGVEALRQIASTSLFLDNENQQLHQQQRHLTTIPTIKEPLDEGSSNASLTNFMSHGQDNLLDPPIEMTKMNTLQVDTLNVIDILSLTDEEIDREIRQIDINQEVVIPKVEPLSLFSDTFDNEEFHIDEVDSEKRSGSSKLHRQRTSLNQSKSAKDSDMLLMETSLTIIDSESLSPPLYTPPPLPLSPNIVTTTFNLPPSTLSLTLPLTSTTTTSDANNQPPTTTTSSSRRHHKHHHHHHSHHHKGSTHKHRHSMAVGRTAPIVDEHGQPIKDSHQITEAELVLSPSKLGQ